jgi:hypothetical protein
VALAPPLLLLAQVVLDIPELPAGRVVQGYHVPLAPPLLLLAQVVLDIPELLAGRVVQGYRVPLAPPLALAVLGVHASASFSAAFGRSKWQTAI